MNSVVKSVGGRYGWALSAMVAAILLRSLLHPWLGQAMPFATLFGAVAIASYTAGWRPALLAAILGYLGCAALFGPSVFSATDVGGLFIYAIVCTCIIAGSALAMRPDLGEERYRLLQRTEERYRRLFTSMQEGLLLAEVIEPGPGKPVDFRYLDMNPAAERILGLSREQVVGKTARALLPAARTDLLEMYAKVAHSGEPLHHEIYESMFDQYHENFVFRPAEGQVAVLFWDITERKRTEQKLAETASSLARERERLAVALRAAHLGVYEWRIGADVVWWSPEVYPVYGVDPATFNPTVAALMALVHPDDRDQFWQKTQESIARREVFMHEYRIIRPDGTMRWVANRSHVGLDGSGNVERITGVAVDITERKLAEQELRVSEQRFRLAADAVNGIIYECDLQTGHVERTRGLYEVMGYRPDEVPGTQTWWLEQIHPDDLRRVSMVDPEIARAGTVPIEYRVRHKDGRWLHVEDRALLLRDSDGKPVKLVGCTVDITERKLAEQELRRLNAELHEADRRKDEFLATLAHELRNPLAPVRNSLELMKLARHNAALVEQARATMERQIVHMVRLIDDLLDVSRITRNKLELRIERLDLASVIRHVLEANRPSCEQARHRLNVVLPAEPIVLNGDPVRLAQVFGNLLTNSCKYTEPGGLIGLTAELWNGEVEVRVKDNGIGIPADILPRVFDPFTQGNRSWEKAAGGLGIGLSLVKRLVEMHGGTVTVHSEGHGCGSEFIVRLPVLPHSLRAREAVESVSAEAVKKTRRILVVDDNRDSADSLAMILGLSGNETTIAYDGDAALEKAAAWRPDVILLDIGMPKLSGLEVCKRIREQPWGKSIVIIALTGWGQDEDRRQSTEAGFDGHLVKPVEPAALLNVLGETEIAAGLK